MNLTNIQNSFINILKNKLEEVFRDGIGTSVLPVYKYKDTLFDALMPKDPSYPPYDTEDVTFRDATKLAFLNTAGAMVSALSEQTMEYNDVTPGSNFTALNYGTIANLRIGMDVTGLIHLNGGVLCTVNTSQYGAIAQLPFRPDKAIIFVGVKSNVPFPLCIQTSGLLTAEGGPINSSENIIVHTQFRV